jgi:hypothetical protein
LKLWWLQAIAPCFPTFDAEGKKEFRNVAQKLIQSLCDAQLLPKECGIRAGSVLNVPEGVRCAAAFGHFALFPAIMCDDLCWDVELTSCRCKSQP